MHEQVGTRETAPFAERIAVKGTPLKDLRARSAMRSWLEQAVKLGAGVLA